MEKSLFKYCPINKYTLENLANNQLYFNPPEMFNDPYEGKFRFTIKNDIIKNEIIELINDKRLFNPIVESQSPNEFMENLTLEYSKQFLKNMRICCMSYINDSILMWSHYADKHKGICIEFDGSDPIFQLGAEVEYFNRIPSISIESSEEALPENINHSFSKIVSSKHCAWKYEKEYRLFNCKCERSLKYKPNSIKAIYFGVRADKGGIEKIRAVIQNNLNIKYYRTDIEKVNYGFNFFIIK